MTVEITTSRAIAAQILRHRSFVFQEFSQRYAKAMSNEKVEARRQDTKNRQNSIDDMSVEDKTWFSDQQDRLWNEAKAEYDEAIRRGIAKEQARFLLPLSTQTTLYMTGNVRNWIHYISLRSENGTQKEHADIASTIQNIFIEQFPAISEALEWR
jgi:thymidylate synthase (FAD)